MNPNKLPEDFDADNVPATVLQSRDGRRAFVWHPLNGHGLPPHPNFLLTIRRLTARRVTVLNAPALPTP